MGLKRNQGYFAALLLSLAEGIWSQGSPGNGYRPGGYR